MRVAQNTRAITKTTTSNCRRKCGIIPQYATVSATQLYFGQLYIQLKTQFCQKKRDKTLATTEKPCTNFSHCRNVTVIENKNSRYPSSSEHFTSFSTHGGPQTSWSSYKSQRPRRL